MKKIFAFIYLLIVSLTVFSQVTFQKTYLGTLTSSARSVKQTNEGDYVIAGGIGSDIFLMKTDYAGNILWLKSYGGNNSEYCAEIAQTSDGGFIMIGNSNSFSSSDQNVYAIKTDSSGNILWSKTYGGINTDLGQTILQTNDGGYIIGAETYSFGVGHSDIYLLRINAGGDTVWAKTLGTAGSDESCSDVQVTSDGGYIFTGGVQYFTPFNYDIYLMKTDSLGNFQWCKTYDVGENDLGYQVRQLSDGGFIIIGFVNLGSGYGIALIRTDSSGGLIWSKAYGGINSDIGFALQLTSDGGFIITGRIESYGLGIGDTYLLKTDSMGNRQWMKTYGMIGYEHCYSVNLTNDGGYILAGFTLDTTSGSLAKTYLIKTDSLGVSGCNESPLNISPIISSTVDSSITMITTFPLTTVVSPPTSVGLPTFQTETLCYVGMDELQDKKYSVFLFPNPATNELRIQDSELKIETVEIYNVLGEKIFSQPSPNQSKQVTVNISELAPGMYFLALTNNEGKRTVKFVKE